MKIPAILLLVLFACQQNDNQLNNDSHKTIVKESNRIGDYWYQGEAEVTSYILSQNRYKGVYEGEVILIQVTEDFLTDKHVKNDRYTNKNSAPILKSNLVTKFTTGIYDYSMMSSTFTNVDGSSSYKVTHSSQDWCGQSWRQINKTKGGYSLSTNSYFESEADNKKSVDDVRLEDELFNQIRILKEDLPQGKMKMLPSLSILSLMHWNNNAVDAICTFSKMYEGKEVEENQTVYQIQMPSLNRTVEILIDTNNEYAIEGWSDTYPSSFDKTLRTSRATKKNRLLVDYWNKNRVSDVEWRKKLDLD